MKLKIILFNLMCLFKNTNSLSNLNCFEGYKYKKHNLPTKTIYLGPGGFTMPYTLGICKYIKDNYKLSEYNFIGSSAGSWLAVYLASDLNENDTMMLIDKYSEEFENSNKNFLYKWHNSGNFLKNEYMNRIKNTNFVNEKKIKISVSRYKNNKLFNELLYDYNNLEELLELCKLSSYIPFLTGNNIPKYNEIITIDSFFTNINFEYDILIYFGTFNRKFTMREIIGRSKIPAKEYFLEGYNDAFKNKILLNSILL